MADFLTFQQLFRIARDEALARSTALRRDVLERSGTDANALIGAGVITADEFQRLGGAMLRDLQTAEDRAEARTKRTEIAAARLSAVTRWHGDSSAEPWSDEWPPPGDGGN